jgi:predicted dehydrogenase
MGREGVFNVGIIGTGGIARFHARGLREESSSLSLKAICDNDVEAMAPFSEEFEVDRRFSNFEELLKDPAIDAVLILLPHSLHVNTCLRAFERGKHVLIEKPIARNIEEADRIIEAAEKAGLTLMVGHNQRFMPIYRKVKNLIAENALGELFCIHIDHHQNFRREKGHWWRSKEAVGGGSVIGSGIHRLDLLLWYLGDVEEVFAYAVDDPRRLEAEVVCAAVLRFKGGAIGEFFCNWGVFQAPRSRTYWGEGLSVFGKRGTLYLEDGETLILTHPDQPEREIQRKTPGTDPVEVKAEPVVPSMWEHFAECIRSRKQPLTSGEQGRRALELVEAIYRSVDSGKPIRLPLS